MLRLSGTHTYTHKVYSLTKFHPEYFYFTVNRRRISISNQNAYMCEHCKQTFMVSLERKLRKVHFLP